MFFAAVRIAVLISLERFLFAEENSSSLTRMFSPEKLSNCFAYESAAKSPFRFISSSIGFTMPNAFEKSIAGRFRSA